MSTGNSNKYRILEVKEIPIRKMMGCHVMRWPYAVYYCHHQVDNSETKVFNILLGGDDDGDKLDAYAACHMDTSKRDPNQLVFKLLNTAPGRFSPVCHIFPEGDLVWTIVETIYVGPDNILSDANKRPFCDSKSKAISRYL
ncbi:BURP domain protein USPL1-like [Tripterygium wilfordii]|uniref:BURP domain protein USPL1-like n=1 Tax=Tripterygium wilfordii TaxID=458696 RepID=UPI0018F7FE5D|nr:BURP domain protein USPL1-like [Tripterygium wilfordii]